jgi:hypothetical protein
MYAKDVALDFKPSIGAVASFFHHTTMITITCTTIILSFFVTAFVKSI